ncbi:alanine racemase [Anaerovorax odorimutans]|uniref:Alanine racemase n=1 Tax=Anaerovorax odorimutans TaxID=109327 RepID=A0ABT1RN86_9FIRM|nr:alanine racemase [Anaerovorax odorimutans]MCQ4636650.1 alanine racemase [Anaerovorax odorimutans]
MYKKAIRPAWVEINLSNLDYNIKNIKAKVGDHVDIIGVIKADGYGHGSVRVAEVLRKNGVRTFAVAALSEAIRLRENGVQEEIIMLGLTPGMYADTIAAYDITPVVCSASNALAISQAAADAGKTVAGLIAIDTGMGRIGYLPEDPGAIEDIKKIDALPNFKIKGLFSHFATADAADKTYAKEQEKRYNVFYEKLTEAGVSVPMRTFANSASVMELPSVYFDAVRPGIILYGCYPSAEVDRSQLSIKPVMSVKANIVHLKRVPKGTTISYGRKFTASRESLIATLALGYADGYPRPYSSVGKVIVNGVFAPIAGNICMDQCMIDVTDVPGVKPGDEVIIMGSDGENTILADDIGDATGTINYEIVCAFGQRLPKIYIE